VINRVVLRKFKRFDEVTFEFPGNVVVAGPNNTGKTTLLQAIAAWNLGLTQWRTLNDYQRHHGTYTRKPITRQTFTAVPLKSFDLLWQGREYRGAVEIEVQSTIGWTVTMEFIADSTEQVYVRPKRDIEPDRLRNVQLDVVFVPPMTGLSPEEPVYQKPYLEQRLGQAKPGDVLRNLLVEAHTSELAWSQLQASIRSLFGYQLMPPDATGAYINAEYTMLNNGPRYDVANAGSGFQQVLMLLTFLNTRKGSVLLLDEPDAHLHIILQDAIYGELKSVARREGSQLVVATHSEVIINSVDPRELCVLLARPTRIATTQERDVVTDTLRFLSNTDIMLAMDSPGILYVEGRTDIDILREWSRILDHPIYNLLESSKLFWKPIVSDQRVMGSGIPARDHHNALLLVRNDLPALELVDGDSDRNIQSTEISGHGFQRLRWKRYEIESYLLHPEAMARYVQSKVGQASEQHVDDLRKHFEDSYPPAFLRDPLGDHAILNNTKARTELIPPALSAAGLPGINYTEYSEIASLMTRDEIHPEVREKLDLIQRAFRL
jgi:predicted ATPase